MLYLAVAFRSKMVGASNDAKRDHHDAGYDRAGIDRLRSIYMEAKPQKPKPEQASVGRGAVHEVRLQEASPAP